jgi:hypothetical protein
MVTFVLQLPLLWWRERRLWWRGSIFLCNYAANWQHSSFAMHTLRYFILPTATSMRWRSERRITVCTPSTHSSAYWYSTLVAFWLIQTLLKYNLIILHVQPATFNPSFVWELKHLCLSTADILKNSKCTKLMRLCMQKECWSFDKTCILIRVPSFPPCLHCFNRVYTAKICVNYKVFLFEEQQFEVLFSCTTQYLAYFSFERNYSSSCCRQSTESAHY